MRRLLPSACCILALGLFALPAMGQACNPNLCNIDQAAWEHISDRHCGECVVNDHSSFNSSWCTDRQSAIDFCAALMQRGDCAGVAQPNGRRAYTATFANNIGLGSRDECNATDHGTVIYDPDTDRVITQFPSNP